MEREYMLVAGMNEAAQTFIRLLQYKGIPFAVLTNNKQEQKQFENNGVATVIRVDTSEQASWDVPEIAIGNVFVFESSLALSCRYLQCCSLWTTKPIYVITPHLNPRAIYKGLGAKYVIYSQAAEHGFLLSMQDTGN